jgi:hypothetical protein
MIAETAPDCRSQALQYPGPATGKLVTILDRHLRVRGFPDLQIDGDRQINILRRLVEICCDLGQCGSIDHAGNGSVTVGITVTLATSPGYQATPTCGLRENSSETA